jgi:hypothetical protein
MQTKTLAHIDAEDRQALLNCLMANPDKYFRAAELKQATGVPKSRVRELLTGLRQVTISTGTTNRIDGSDVKRVSKIYWYKWRK